LRWRCAAIDPARHHSIWKAQRAIGRRAYAAGAATFQKSAFPLGLSAIMVAHAFAS
jgi:hypothetical protein